MVWNTEWLNFKLNFKRLAHTSSCAVRISVHPTENPPEAYMYKITKKKMKIKCVNMIVHVCLYLLIYICCLFSFFQSTESQSFVMGLFKGKLNVQQVFPYPEGMYFTIFFIPYLDMDLHVLLNQNTCLFFFNTCTKAGHKCNMWMWKLFVFCAIVS